ncbi:hypothetical protein ANCDUO_06206 [Ancylostoma duodenale]|uniref:Ubiquinol-cytochrome C reductase hinge domain-containing protein n=1 Tax=Ancylostoma duodenale TaxID=51022 RepID=A0A0C2H259_9BILA|nr:hypothetical protein ANCDUO_06206 [Ancylostoma duodenale]
MPGDDEPLQEGVDQVQQWRDRCAEQFTDLKARLDECNDRVNSRKETTETCVERRLSYPGYDGDGHRDATVLEWLGIDG